MAGIRLLICLYVVFCAVKWFTPYGVEYDVFYNAISSAQDTIPWVICFQLIKYMSFVIRSVMFAIVIGCFINIPLVCLCAGESTTNMIVFFAEISAFCYLLANAYFRKISIKSDEYSKDKTYILAKIPSGFWGFLSCAHTDQIGGVSIVCCGVIGTYRKESREFCLSRYNNKKDDVLIEIDCDPVYAAKHLANLEGRKYSTMRNNCVNAAAVLVPSYDPIIATPIGLVNHAVKLRGGRK